MEKANYFPPAAPQVGGGDGRDEERRRHGRPKSKTEELKPTHQEPPELPAPTHAKEVKTADN